MKLMCGFLLPVIGLCANMFGSAAAFGWRRHLHYSPNGPLAREGTGSGDNFSSTDSLDRLSLFSGVVDRDSSLRDWDPTATWNSPITSPQRGSLLQLQSEAEEEEDSTDSEDKESLSTSSEQSEGGKDPPRAKEEVASDNGKRSDGTEKQESSNTVINDASRSISSEKDDEGGGGSDVQQKLHTKQARSPPSSTESGAVNAGPPLHRDEHTNLGASRNNNMRQSKAHSLDAGSANSETDIETFFGRLRALLKASKGKELFSRLLTLIDLHEKEAKAELELRSEAEKFDVEKRKTKEEVNPNIVADKDLLINQQLTNMWTLPFHEEGKRDTCLSGLEKLAHEATITCADPMCFKLETQAKQCPYMSIVSIMRKEDLELEHEPPNRTTKRKVASQKDHMLLGFDGECRQPERLGSDILSILQRPKHLAKKHAFERSTGSGGTAPVQKHHLDLVCDPREDADFSVCGTLYEALQHVSKREPRALPELVVLTDIQDLKNTLGMYRITFLFEGLVQFSSEDGTKIDSAKHKIPSDEAEFVQKHRHDNITGTVMLKGT